MKGENRWLCGLINPFGQIRQILYPVFLYIIEIINIKKEAIIYGYG